MIEVPPGRFYIGESVDEASERTGEPLLYKADHLTTHGVIVGMTGSGKTGLGIDILEEALLQGVPTIILDPKGDMGNLALTFPEMTPADLVPWVSPDEAEAENITPRRLAAETARMWTEGLADWGIGLDRIARLRDSAPVTIYTPGSEAGSPLNVIGSLRAPDDLDDMESVRDEIEGFVTSVLTLVDIDSDPLSSREHILLSNLIENAWTEGRDLDMAGLLGEVLQPPIRKLGVFDLDQFYPAKDRTELAMRLNAVIASPSFAAWSEGPPIDIDRLTRTDDGRPRAAVISLGHLTDTERQFVVTLILSRLITWMRAQPGSGDLRLLIYMDEVFGFLPPTAMPPSKKPLLTILKQGRAFGVGMLLSTQNPVDLDYKALSNTGTWMIGRLQTERDKARLMDGLNAAGDTVDVGALGDTISGLPKRTFVLHETRSSAPVVFRTRWAMSYLAGPLSRAQIRILAENQDVPAFDEDTAASETGTGARGTPGRSGRARRKSHRAEPVLAPDETPQMPPVADGVEVRWVDPAAPWAADVGAVAGGRRLEAAIVARVNLLFDEAKAKLRHTEEYEIVQFPLTDHPDPARAIGVDYDERDLLDRPPAGAVYVSPEAPIGSKKFFNDYARALKNDLYQNQLLVLFHNPSLKIYGRPLETAEEFARRCAVAASEAADAEAAKLRSKYESRLDRADAALVKAEDRIRELETARDNRKRERNISVAGDLLNVFLGGRRGSRDLARTIRRGSRENSRASQADQRLRTARNREAQARERIIALEDELADELVAITDEWNSKAADISEIEVGLEKNDISVDEVVLAWIPVRSEGR